MLTLVLFVPSLLLVVRLYFRRKVAIERIVLLMGKTDSDVIGVRYERNTEGRL